MFKFFKEKIKKAVNKFSKDVEEESEVIEEKAVAPKPKVKKVEKKPKGEKKKHKEEKSEIKKEEIKIKKEEKTTETPKEVSKPSKLEKLDQEVEKVHDRIEPKEKVKIKLTQGIEPKTEVNEKRPLSSLSEQTEPKVEPKKGFLKKIFGKKEKPEEKVEETKVAEGKLKDQKIQETAPEKKGIFTKVTQSFTTTQLSEKKFDDIFFELEMALLESNVALEVIDKIKADMKEKIVDQKIKRGELETKVMKSLTDSIHEVLSVESINLKQKLEEKKPYVIMFIGVNGSGKTTNLAKVANYFKTNGYKPVIAACDTFRAAAIQQLEEHAKNVGVKVIKQGYGADPAAVAFDAIEHAKAQKLDVVLIDTAGRLHSNTNLMDEMKKIVRVSKPDMKIFIGESVTGNDCVEQAKNFDAAVGIDGIILTKADIDEKGGAALSISYVTKKPILFIGTGQDYNDIKLFDKKIILENLGLE